MIPPPATSVEVDVRKLREYALDVEHPRGGNKARVLRAALGLTMDDADRLKQTVLAQIHSPHTMPVFLYESVWGLHFRLEFRMTTERGSAIVRTGWVIDPGSTTIRLVTCFIPRKKDA